MLNFSSFYKKYPYTIPARVRFFNLIRFFFKIQFLERFLIYNLSKGNSWWRKFIPPVYFYEQCTIRNAKRQGINYLLDISCLIDHSIFFYVLQEPAWENLFKIVKPNFIVFDIGANIGFLTLNFARICNTGFVFAFEPDSKNFKSLNANIEKNDFKNIRLYQIALGEESKKMVLHKMEVHNPGANRILPGGVYKQHDHEVVDVATLDAMADEIKTHHIDLLKIDVEGFEMFVLKGGKKVLKKYKPILFIELADANLKPHGLSSRMLIEYIENLNYEVIDARTMLAVDRSKKDHHTDILCFFRS